MTIADLREKCKTALRAIPRDVLILGTLVGVALLSFVLGFNAGIEAGQGNQVLMATPDRA